MTENQKFLMKFAAAAARLLPQGLKQAIYRSRPLARAIRSRLNRAAPQGLSEIQVAAGILKGQPLLLDLQAEKDYWLGTYEPELQAALRRWLQPGWVVFDVGANIGYVSLMLARMLGPRGKVFAFEALPANIQRLRRNLSLNPQAPVEVIHAAVVETERAVHFLTGPSHGMGKVEGSAGRQDVAYGETLVVDGLSLDAFVFTQGHPQPQVVKMDIEGGEVLALPGMRRLLAQAHPLLFLELHGEEAARAAWQVLTEHGYRLQRMQAGYPPVNTLAELDWKAYLVAFPPGQEPG